MDPLTHAISGAALARALPSTPLPGRKIWLLIVLTMAPDADYLLSVISDTLYLQHHRGLTHSLLMLPLWAWLLHTLFRAAPPSTDSTLPAWLIAAAIALHIMLDLITSFGTMILAPLSDWRAALDLIFIIDPLFTACLLLPLLVGLIVPCWKRPMAILSLILMSSYLTIAFLAHGKAIETARQAHHDAISVAALPLPFSPFHWQLIASYPGHYLRTAVNLWPDFSGTTPLFPEEFVQRYAGNLFADRPQWQQLPAMESLRLPDSMPGVAFYRWFARFPVVLHQSQNRIECGDLRFGAGIEGLSSSFRLIIDLKPTPNARLVWRRNRSSSLNESGAPFSWLHSPGS